MTNNDQIERVILAYEVDQGKLAEVSASQQSLLDGLISIRNSTLSLTEASNQLSAADQARLTAVNSLLLDNQALMDAVASVEAQQQAAKDAYVQRELDADAQIKAEINSIANLRDQVAARQIANNEAVFASQESLRAQLAAPEGPYGSGGALEDTSGGDTSGGSSGGGLSNISGITGLRRTGSALTQLGLGDIGKPIQQLGALGQVVKELGVVSEAAASGGIASAVASLGPLALVAATVGVAIFDVVKTLDILKQSAADAASAERSMIDAQTELDTLKAADEIKARTETEKQNQQNIADNAARAAGYNKQISDLQSKIDDRAQQYADLGASFNPGQRSKLGALSQEDQKAIDDFQKKVLALNLTWVDSTSVLTPLIEANQAAVFWEKARAEQNKAIDTQFLSDVQSNAAIRAEISKLERDGTTVSFDAAKQAAAAKISLLQDEIKQIKDSGDVSDAAKAKLAGSNTELTHAETEYLQLTPAVRDATAANEALRQSYTDALTNATKFNAEIQSGAKTYQAAVENLSTGIAAAEATAAQKRADIAATYADKLVATAQAEADKRQAAFETEQDKLTQLNLSYQRQQTADTVAEQDRVAAERVKFQQEDVKAYRDHADAILQIQEAANATAYEQELNRDFAGVEKTRRDEANKIEASNDTFVKQRQDKAIADQQTLNAQQVQDAQLRARQLLDYQNKLTDANTAYKEQLDRQAAQDKVLADRAAAANAKSLEAVDVQLAKEEALKTASYKKTLDSIGDTTVGFASVVGRAKDAITADLNQITAALGIQSFLGALGITSRAGGGSLAAGQASFVNDLFPGQREAFNGSPFPRGIGLFVPMQAGQVSQGRGGGDHTHISVPVTIVGVSESTAREIAKTVSYHVVGEVLDAIGK